MSQLITASARNVAPLKLRSIPSTGW